MRECAAARVCVCVFPARFINDFHIALYVYLIFEKFSYTKMEKLFIMFLKNSVLAHLSRYLCVDV